MGKTAQELLDAGSHEVVVVADGVRYRDPEDSATDPREYTHLPAFRGERITVDEGTYKRLTGLNAVADPDSNEARLAAAGIRTGDTAVPPSALPMQGPTAERVRATQSAAQFPGGPNPSVRSPEELARLSVEDLRIVATAFGVPVTDDDTKGSLVERLTSGGVEAATIDAQRSARDTRQLDAREFGPNAPHISALQDGDTDRENASEGESDVGTGLDEAGDAQASADTTATTNVSGDETTRVSGGRSGRARTTGR